MSKRLIRHTLWATEEDQKSALTIEAEDDTSTEDEPNKNTREEPNADSEAGQDNDTEEQPSGEEDQETITPEIDFDAEKTEVMELIASRKDDEAEQKLMDLRDQEKIDPGDRKFIEDNLAILSLCDDSEIADIRKSMRSQLKKAADESDQNGFVLEMLVNQASNKNVFKNTLLKLPAFCSFKADLWRKFIAACLGGVQTGFGGNTADIIIQGQKGKNEPSPLHIELSTRCYADFGIIEIGDWTLKATDPERYLDEDELDRLNNSGSPNEKSALRERVVIESICNAFDGRKFIIAVCDYDTGIATLTEINLSQFLLSGYKAGTIVVQVVPTTESEASISSEGEFIPLSDIELVYRQQGDFNNSIDILFIKQVKGRLFIAMQKEPFMALATETSSGIYTTEILPDQAMDAVRATQLCKPDIKEVLLKQC